MLLVILYSSVVSQFFCLYHGGNLRLVGERCMEEPNWPLHVWAVSKSQYLVNLPIFCWLHHGETSRNLVLKHPPFQFTGLQAVASASLPQVEMLGILVGGRSELTRGPRWAVDVVRISLRRCFWLVVTGTMEFYDFPYIGNFIIPTDELHHSISCGCSRLWSSAPASLTCLTL